MAQLLGVEGVAEQQKEGRRSDSPLPTCVGWTALRQADSPLHVWGVRRREDHTRRLIRSRINRTFERTNPRYIPDICHFFTLTYFEACKFYTQKCVNLRQICLTTK